MAEPVFPAVPQPPMRQGHTLPQDTGVVTALLDNRTGLPDEQVREAIRDHWVEAAGLQFAQPTNFALYASGQGSMLARTPFRTPRDVIEEIKLARTIADTDDDAGGIMGEMIAIAFGEGVVNQHRDETTLEFFNQIAAPTGMNLEATLAEMYRELLIAASVTTITLFTRKRMQYFPLKSDIPVASQLQVPNVGILPAENIRVISNDVLGDGELAYNVEDNDLRTWLDAYFAASGNKKAIMAMAEPVAAALFTGKIQVPYNDGDPASRGMTLYTLNPRMVHRTTLPKGANPYPRPLLTRNFALLEAKRLLNLMDYALLQGGTNYIVVAKKGSDTLPAQQPEIDNLVDQVSHASRSGVMVGDHRLTVEIITPKLDELLNPAKRKLLGRKIKMGLMRQSEEVTGDSGTQGATNEMELTSRVVSYDRRVLLRHAQSTFYDETAIRNRSTFSEGAPSIWAPKIVLAGVKDFWSNLLQARDRGDIPRRWVVEALGYDYDSALAEREREIQRGDDEILTPGSVPFSNPGAGPQDNGPGRPVGTSTNNGRGQDTPGQGRDPFAPNRVIRRTAGETIKAIVEDNSVIYVGETTAGLLAEYEESADFSGYVMAVHREAIDCNQTIRQGSGVVVPVNPHLRVTDLACVKLTDGLRMVVGKGYGNDAMFAKALHFSEPQYDLRHATEYALRWGFIAEPLVEDAAKKMKRCKFCGNALPSYSPMNPVCPNCGHDNTDPEDTGPRGDGGADENTEMSSAIKLLTERVEELAKGNVQPGRYVYLKCPNCGLVQDADHKDCTRCGQDLTQARRGMFSYYEKKGIKPILHKNPPPPASKQKDYRTDKALWISTGDDTLMDELAYRAFAAATQEEFSTKWTAEKRAQAEKNGDALPGGKFPILDQSDLDNAVGLIGNSTLDRSTVVAHIKKQAKKHGLKLPDSLT